MLLLLELKILLSGSADAVVSLLVLRSRAASQGAENQHVYGAPNQFDQFFLKTLADQFFSHWTWEKDFKESRITTFYLKFK